jgi:ribonuclease BN (tRNA processing enzyme)
VETVVLGCGEAFDEMLPNTSLLIRTERAKVLLDCGYSIPREVWHAEPDPAAIDLIYISHAHADHYFGLPALLGRMWDEGRTKPLVLMSQQSVLDSIVETLEYGYRNLRQRFLYPLEFRAITPEAESKFGPMTFRFAPTTHASPNLAIRIETGGHAVCYSGDGDLTDASRELYRGADLLLHEAFSFDDFPVHASVSGVLRGSAQAGVRRVGLVHVQRSLRRDRAKLFEAMLAAEVRCILPNPGDVLFV